MILIWSLKFDNVLRSDGILWCDCIKFVSFVIFWSIECVVMLIDDKYIVFLKVDIGLFILGGCVWMRIVLLIKKV